MWEYQAEVVRIVDGDTLHAMVDLGFSVKVAQVFRLARVDTPEIRGEERPDGLRAKAFVENALPVGSAIVIRTFKDKQGKYGRYLAEVTFRNMLGEWVNLSDILLEGGYAKPYG